MNRTRASLIVLGIVILSMLGACETTSARDSNAVNAGSPDDPFSLTVMSYQDVRSQYGPTFMQNPFMAPAGGIFPQANDYVVLKLNFNTPAKAQFVLLRAEVTDDRGKVLAAYMTRDKFADFAMTQSPDQASNTTKRNEIDWYYLPNPIMTIDSGRHSYLLVLVGKHPISDAGTIHVAVSVDNKATAFDLPMPVSSE